MIDSRSADKLISTTLHLLLRLRRIKSTIHVAVRTVITSALLIVGLISCSDSPGGGGIGGTGKTDILIGQGLVSGTIDSAGGINGIIYDTSNATVTVDGNNGDIAALKTGMYVSARVDHDRLVAQSITYQPNVRGPIQSIDADGSTIQVLNNEISISLTTEFDDTSATELAVGSVVEVSGTRTANNQIVADYVAQRIEQSEFFTVGTVAEQSSDPNVAQISGIGIDLSQVIIDSGMTAQQFATTFLTAGTQLRAAFAPAIQASAGEPLVASSLTVLETNEYRPGESIQIAGAAIHIQPNSIVVNGKLITVDAETTGFTLLGEQLDSFTIMENESVVVNGLTLIEGSEINQGDTDSDGDTSASLQIYAISIVFLDRL